MCTLGRFPAFLSLSIVCICACKAGTQAPTPLITINAPQGGKIVYGAVAGATIQAAALSSMLSTVHKNCGEKRQIGRVFQFSGTNSVGVFFTVIDHPDGNIPLAGPVIAAASGPNQVQAAMLYDNVSRFGSTVNPMLQQLSNVWHPGAAPTASGSSDGANTASTTGSPAGLHQVVLHRHHRECRYSQWVDSGPPKRRRNHAHPWPTWGGGCPRQYDPGARPQRARLPQYDADGYQASSGPDCLFA